MLIDHMASGLSFESFSAETNPFACERTLYNWVEQYPDFFQAKTEAFALNRKFWEKLGIAGTVGKIQGFNVTGWIFNMKNRFRAQWHDQIRIDAKVSGRVEVEHKMVEERIKELSSLLEIANEKEIIEIQAIELPDNQPSLNRPADESS